MDSELPSDLPAETEPGIASKTPHLPAIDANATLSTPIMNEDGETDPGHHSQNNFDAFENEILVLEEQQTPVTDGLPDTVQPGDVATFERTCPPFFDSRYLERTCAYELEGDAELADW